MKSLSLEKQDALNKLNENNVIKEARIKKITEKINKLQDKKNISQCKEIINKCSSNNKTIDKYSETINKINTTNITNLSSKANQELVTDTLKKYFQDELSSLTQDIEVSLEKGKAKKGISNRKLVILGNNVNEILSDGEQKAVAIALFIAENRMQNNKYPIIFDDPVTSIDHKIADCLAERLIKLSMEKQIIIFTHNKLFYDSLIHHINNLKDKNNNKLCHICKDITNLNNCNNNKNHHVYIHQIVKEAKDRTGKTRTGEIHSTQYFIERAEKKIKENDIPSASHELKSAIEYFIDEKILLSVGLMKDRNKQNIPWDILKKFYKRENSIDIDKLKTHWDNLSSRGTHLTRQSNENPITQMEMRKIIEFLKA